MSTQLPISIIILGGGGDLAVKKLLPSLFDLFIQKKLPHSFQIIGLARTGRTDAVYRDIVLKAVLQARPLAQTDDIDIFCNHVEYVTGALDDTQSYFELKSKIADFGSREGVQNSNVLFYLAVPPLQYEGTLQHLYDSKLAVIAKGSSHFVRILIEKPFGSDYDSALKLDTLLQSLFSEEQIFRIDHYLAKEAVQNILSFRFANTLFKSAWNNKHIKEVAITMFEKVDVGTRGAFYDTVGALRDVGQNHLLQILALIAMDEPQSLSSQHIRQKRSDILKKLVPIEKQNIENSVIRAQYEGYLQSTGVHESSTTETYFEFRAFIDEETWQGVPFIVRSGKALTEEKVCVEIFFHDVATGPFETSASKTVGNTILLTISPQQSMHVTLNVKQGGHGYHIESNTLKYEQDTSTTQAINAYEKVLLDCILGDQTLFTTTDEVLASWKFIHSITENWRDVKLQTYTKGSNGPTDILT